MRINLKKVKFLYKCRDEKGNLKSTDANLITQKLAPSWLFKNHHETDLFGRISKGLQNPCALDAGNNLARRGISAHIHCSLDCRQHHPWTPSPK